MVNKGIGRIIVQLIGSTQVKIIYSLTQKNMTKAIEKNI
jgi:hypothetical protein